MKEFAYGQFGPEHLKKVAEGVKAFNSQHYWECHEELEDVWLEDRNDPARNVYWAIIQVAASMVHYRDKKIIGTQGMLNKARKKFQKCRDQNILTDLVFRFLSWEELEEIIKEIPQENSKLEDYEKLYHFRFLKYPYLKDKKEN